MDSKQFLYDPEMRATDIASRIAPRMSSWPVTEHIHWQFMKTAAEEARDRLDKYYEKRDEIESDPRLTREGKLQDKRKAALRALGAFSGSKSLSRAQQSVSHLMDKWQARVTAAIKPAATEAQAALHAEIRKHAASLQGARERMSFVEKHGADPRVASALLEAPAFLSGIGNAEIALVRSKIEKAVLDPEIVQAKKDVTRALADSEHGWERAQVLIGEDAGLRKSADGTWSQAVDADAAA